MLGGAAIRMSTSSISRGPSPPGVRGQQRPGHRGQPRGRRHEQRGQWRRRVLGDQLPARRGDQAVRRECAASSCSAAVVAKEPCGDGTFDRVPRGSPLVADPAARRSADRERVAERGILDHPGDRRGRLSDHPQAGVGGDADIGVAQHQSGAAWSRPCRPLRIVGGHLAAVALVRQLAVPHQNRARTAGSIRSGGSGPSLVSGPVPVTPASRPATSAYSSLSSTGTAAVAVSAQSAGCGRVGCAEGSSCAVVFDQLAHQCGVVPTPRRPRRRRRACGPTHGWPSASGRRRRRSRTGPSRRPVLRAP